MELSILQHAKDTSPKAVGISEIVDLIRGDQWPPGYQPVLLVHPVLHHYSCGHLPSELYSLYGLQRKEVPFILGLREGSMGLKSLGITAEIFMLDQLTIDLVV